MDKGIASYEAYKLQNDPAFVQAVDDAEALIFKAWKGEKSLEEREALWHKLQGLYAIKSALQVRASDVQIEMSKRD